MMRIDIVSIFPDYLAPLDLSLIGKARQDGTVHIEIHDLRDFTDDVHRTVDDTPFGGGPGMVMTPEPWGRALDAVRASGEGAPHLVIPTPSGVPYDQPAAQRYAELPWIVLACGRYEGIDARVAQHYRSRSDWAGVSEQSLGDVVLAGGEVVALAIVESVVRLLPGVLGNAASVSDDSFAPGAMANLLEGPVYTKPRHWRDLDVPDVLLSGDHGAIATWRQEQAEAITRLRRPDLAGPGRNSPHD
jgi:tRNA (guanine37-N1)-methyltransferase